MKYTNNYNLKMPEQTDYINVDDFNYNFIQIDKQIEEEISSIPKPKPATPYLAGLVKVDSLAGEDELPHIVPTANKTKDLVDRGVKLLEDKLAQKDEELKTMIIETANRTSDLEDKLERLENAILSDVTGNPFEVSFKDLEGLEVTGYWNKELQRLEV